MSAALTPGRRRVDGASVAVAGLALLAAAGLFLFPFATLTRSFDGSGALLVHPGNVVDFTGFLPPELPNFRATTFAGWLNAAALVVLAGLALTRSRWLTLAASVVALVTVTQLVAFVRAVDLAQLPLLTGPNAIPYRRLPFRDFGPNLAAFLPLLAVLVTFVIVAARDPRRARALERWRAGVVPAVAILLSVAVGGIVILLLQPVPGSANGPASLARGWLGKADLLWYSYSTLFGPALPRFRPMLDLAGPWQSLQLATPLIFTGLGLAFGFRTGLFNIGAPGQIILGAIFTTAVGVYVPGPWWLIAPLAIAAAALGGALWGAIPGWLKARFGSSEVINTIMLNYIASSLLVFLLGSTRTSFFGQTVSMPFKAPGLESKSYELQAGAQFPTLVNLIGLRPGENPVSLGPILAVIVLLLVLWRRRGNLRARLIPAVGAAAVALVVGLILPRLSLPLSTSMASVRLSFALILALLAAVFYGVFMWRTRYGYELRAVGLSPGAAEYGGVNIARNVVLAMAISGALCGLAATHYVLGGALEEYRLKQVIPADAAGFGGITVALLGQNTPAGVIASAVLFGVLGTGGLNLDQALDKVSRDIVTVLQALIVVFIATRGFLSSRYTGPRAPGADASSPPLEAHVTHEGPEPVGKRPVPLAETAGEGGRN